MVHGEVALVDSFKNNKGEDKHCENDKAGASEKAKEIFVCQAPPLNFGDIATSSNKKAQDDKRKDAKDGENNETESLESGVETKRRIGGENEKREGKKDF